MDNKSLENRKEFIITAVKKFYNNFSVLKDIPFDDLMNDSLDKYLNSNLSTTEILDDLRNLVIVKEKKVIERINTREERKNLITGIVTSYYNSYNFLRANLSLNELIDKALAKYIDSNLEDRKIVDEISDMLYTMQREYQEKDNNKITTSPEYTQIDSESSNQLNTMFDTSMNISNENVISNNENNKILIKTDNNNNNENNDISDNNGNNKGVVSIFSIMITILVVTAMVLVTMILLTLMK